MFWKKKHPLDQATQEHINSDPWLKDLMDKHGFAPVSYSPAALPAKYDDVQCDWVVDGHICPTVREYKAACKEKYGE